MAIDGAELVERARREVAKLHKETGANVQKDIAPYVANYGKGPGDTSLETVTKGKKIEPFKATVPEEKKTSADKMWDRRSEPEKMSETTRAKQEKDKAKKQHEDYFKALGAKRKELSGTGTPNIIQNNPYGYNADLAKEIQGMERQERVLRARAEQAEKEYDEEKNRQIFERDMEVITGLPEEDRKALEWYHRSLYDADITMDNDVLNAMREKYGKDQFDQLERTFSIAKNEEQNKRVDEKTREFVNKRGGRGLVANIASIPVNAYSGLIGSSYQISEMIRGTGEYTTLDPYAGAIGNTFTNAVRGQTSENIIEDLGDGFVGQAANIGYQAAMSAADSVARAYLGGGAVGGATLAGTGAFSQTMSEASKNGATPAEAAMLATTSAFVELAAEKIPLDNLIKTAGGETGKSVIKNILTQAGIEIAEEEITLLANVFLEAAILQEKSNYNQAVNKYILEDGLSPEEAAKQADLDILNEAINTALVSGLSGGMSGSAASYADKVNPISENPQLLKGKKTEIAKTKQEILEKYGQKYIQEEAAQRQKQEEIEKDLESAPESIKTAMRNQAKDDEHSDRVASYRSDDITQIENDPEAMQWLKDRGLEGDMQKALSNVAGRKYEIKSRENTVKTQQQNQNVPAQAQEEAAPQKKAVNATPTAQKNTPPSRLQYGQRVKAGDRGNIGKILSYNESTDSYNVNFTSKSGTTKNVTMPASSLTPVGKIIQPKAQKGTTSAPVVQQGTVMPADYKPKASNNQSELQRDRINAVREQEVTVKDPNKKTVTEFAGNAYQSALTPDSFTDSIKRLVDEGQVSHDVQTNEASLKKGADMIAAQKSERNAVNHLRDYANKGSTSPEYIAMGTLLYHDLTAQIEEQTKSGKVDPNLKQDTEDVFVSLSQMATNSGRALQLFNLFRKMSPDSQVNVLQREIQNEVKKLQNRGTVKKGYEASPDPQLMQLYKDAAMEYNKAKTDAQKQEAEAKMQEIQNVIYLEEAAKMPTTFKAKWDAWRYMAMLGNVKTQVRNVLGNAVMMPYTEVKRKFGAAIEAVLIRDKSQRTKAFFQDRELLNWAKNDAQTAIAHNALEGSAKLSDDKTENRAITDNLKTFGDGKVGEILNKLQKIVGDVTQKGDFVFKNKEYAKSLAGFLKARGYDAQDAQTDGAIPVEVMNEARNYAVNEAMRATFNDSNALSDWFASIGRREDSNIFGKAANAMLEGIVPFRKTPANVLARGWEYSPLGIITTAVQTGADIRNGKYSAASAIDRLSANLTGTAAFALGIALSNGIGNIKLVGSGVDEDEERHGHQKFALEVTINGETYSYSIDWAAPSVLPLFMGANLNETLNNPGTESLLSAIASVGLNTLEPMLELSCLSGLNDFLETGRYAEEGGVSGTLLAKAATSYITQGIPSLARQASQATQENKQTTFVDSDDKLVQGMQRTAAGVPFAGDAYKTDKVNEWGEKESQGTAGERIFNAFVNPGTFKKIDNSALEQEIKRLNKAQPESVSPPIFSKVVSYTDKDGTFHKDHRMTEEEYQKLAQTQGQTTRAILESMINSKSYQNMNDEMKAKAMKMAYSYAREKAMGETFDTSFTESWMMDIKSGKEAAQILQRTADNALSNAFSKLNTAWDNKYSETNTENYSRELEKAYESYSEMEAADKRIVKETATGSAAKYIEAREKGISHADFVNTAKSVNNVKGSGKNGTVRDIDKRQAIARTPGLTTSETDRLMKVYMPDYDPNDESPETTEFKYDYARQELGLSPQEYASTYRAYLDNSKKNQRIKAIQALGYDYSTAQKLYKLYNGGLKKQLLEMYG
jgi:hypothetical protein